MRLSLANLHELEVSPKPVGVFCFNDYNAQILELECLKLGLHIPEDIAIIGVDNNTMFCENVPVPLSSVALDFEYISYCGSRVLADILDGRPPCRDDAAHTADGHKDAAIHRHPYGREP